MSRRWCFTLNNYSDSDVSTMAVLDGAVYVVFGKEIGESDTPHLQGFVIFEKMKRLSALKKINSSAHWEAAKAESLRASDYCKKGSQSHAEWSESGTAGPTFGIGADVTEYGVLPVSQGKRTDLKRAIDDIDDGLSMHQVASRNKEVYVKFYRGLKDYALQVAPEYSHPTVRGLWVWGPTGTGKSYEVRASFPSLFIKGQNHWFDGFQGQEAIFIDDFTIDPLCSRQVKAWERNLKAWADSYHCTGETKGGTINLNHHHFIITSNYSIEDLFGKEEAVVEPLKRRFKQIEKTKRGPLFVVYDPTLPVVP